MSLLHKIGVACEARLNEVGKTVGLRKKLLVGSYFAGGMITSITKGEEVKDYDLFFSTKEAATSAFNSHVNDNAWGNWLNLTFEKDPINPNIERGVLVTVNQEYSLEQVIAKFNEYAKLKKNFQAKFLSKNALSLKNKTQMIFRFVAEPEELFTTFDYEHCKVYWRPTPLGLKLGKVSYCGRSLESLAKNELIYTGNSRFVLSAVSRLNKFISRGWGIAPSSLLRLAVSTSKIQWDNPKVLEEELLGIYGIDGEALTTILEKSQQDGKTDLDKVIEMLGEV